MKLKLIREKIAGQLEKPIETSTACKFFIGGIAAALIYVNGLSLITDPTPTVNVSIAENQESESTVSSHRYVYGNDTTESTELDHRYIDDITKIAANIQEKTAALAESTENEKENDVHFDSEDSQDNENEKLWTLGGVRVIILRDHTNGTMRYVLMDNCEYYPNIGTEEQINKTFIENAGFDKFQDLYSSMSYISFQGIFEDNPSKYTEREMNCEAFNEQRTHKSKGHDSLQALRIGNEYYVIKTFNTIETKSDGTIDIRNNRRCYYYPDYLADPDNYIELDLSIEKTTLSGIYYFADITDKYNIDELKSIEERLNADNELYFNNYKLVELKNNTTGMSNFFYTIMSECYYSLYNKEQLKEMYTYPVDFSSYSDEDINCQTEYIIYDGIFNDASCTYEVIDIELYTGYSETYASASDRIEILKYGNEAYKIVSQQVSFKGIKDETTKAYYYPNYQNDPDEYVEVDVSIDVSSGRFSSISESDIALLTGTHK